MALKGTLNNLGCADVFQLIGMQNRTGLLMLRSRQSAVDIWFHTGVVVRVEDMSRDPKMRLGELLIRAGLLSKEALQEALATQRKTRKRLGDVLVQNAFVSPQTLSEFTKLQSLETLYNAFLWRRGSYEFLPDVSTMADPELGNGIRWDNAIIEGVRRAGDWPTIRELVPSNEHTFKVVKPLNEEEAGPDEPPAEDDFSFGDLDEEGSGGPKKKKSDIGPNEHLIYALIRPGITVQRLIDRSYLGDYETCRSIWKLAKEGYIEGADDQELEIEEAEELEGEDTAQRELMLTAIARPLDGK